MKKCSCDVHKGYDKLFRGKVVNVYLEQEDGSHLYEGTALLINKLKQWYSPEPFPVIEKCNDCGRTVNNIKERWTVEPIDDNVFDRGKQVVRNIHTFHSHGTPHIRDVYDDKEFFE